MRSPVHNGVLVTLALLLAGAAAAGVAWWNNLSHTREALDFWGAEAALLIRDAPEVTAFRITLSPTGDAASAEPGHHLSYPVTRDEAHVHQARDISRAKGLVHLRHALLDDRSFDWAAGPSGPGELRYALAFEREGRRLVAYFSEDFTRLTTAGAPGGADGGMVSTKPIAQGLDRYFADVLPASSPERGNEQR